MTYKVIIVQHDRCPGTPLDMFRVQAIGVMNAFRRYLRIVHMGMEAFYGFKVYNYGSIMVTKSFCGGYNVVIVRQ